VSSSASCNRHPLPALLLFSVLLASPSDAQQPAPPTPAQIELLETKVRFESTGDSRKEVHCIVKINSELGVRQFARLSFDYNRSFENIEIPMVRVTHSGGGTADILPGAISDNPNPAVASAPAYQDVRVKSVRILGLAPSDTLEYRVLTTVTHHPLAPDFWLEHSFDRTGIVSRELFELDLPAVPQAAIRTNPATPPRSKDSSGEGRSGRETYRWDIAANSIAGMRQDSLKEASEAEPDVALSTANQWLLLSIRLDASLRLGSKGVEGLQEPSEQIARAYQKLDPEIVAKARELTLEAHSTRASVGALYEFVSQKIKTVNLPLGATGFAGRPAKEILVSGYATPEDKFVLFAALAAAAKLGGEAGLTGNCDEHSVASPLAFKHLFVRAGDGQGYLPWADPSLEVAPFGFVPPGSGSRILVINSGFVHLSSTGHEWEKLEPDPPFPSTQRVSIDAVLGSDGTLRSKVRYAMRGQNELLLRVAFHQSPKEKWNEVAQLLALSDGFRGKIESVTPSDPYATKNPFTVEYEIVQLKFVDWSKKPVRIPAILPLVGLPDPPAKSASGPAASTIDLGTPLDVQTTVTLHLPPGTTVESPAATAVDRDYATFSSKYAATANTLTATRHIQFLLRELPASRGPDYNAFLHAVQNDQAQLFTLTRSTTAIPPTPSATPKAAPR
jgi:hypothetical protein